MARTDVCSVPASRIRHGISCIDLYIHVAVQCLRLLEDGYSWPEKMEYVCWAMATVD